MGKDDSEALRKLLLCRPEVSSSHSEWYRVRKQQSVHCQFTHYHSKMDANSANPQVDHHFASGRTFNDFRRLMQLMDFIGGISPTKRRMPIDLTKEFLFLAKEFLEFQMFCSPEYRLPDIGKRVASALWMIWEAVTVEHHRLVLESGIWEILCMIACATTTNGAILEEICRVLSNLSLHSCSHSWFLMSDGVWPSILQITARVLQQSDRGCKLKTKEERAAGNHLLALLHSIILGCNNQTMSFLCYASSQGEKSVTLPQILKHLLTTRCRESASPITLR